MGRVAVSIHIPRRASEAEALWYDTRRWASFVDGLKHVATVEGDWPRAGARVLWDSHPGGRGRVMERVLRYESRSGQELAVEDEQIRGTQRIAFEPRPDGVQVRLELEFELKQRRPLQPVVDALFLRRPWRESMQRTLHRFRAELTAEGDPLT